MIREAIAEDIDRIAQIYDAVHKEEEKGNMSIGWESGVYPTRQTAVDAIERNDMFVEIMDDTIVAAAIINQKQVPEYSKCEWKYIAEEQDIMVLHTLVVDPERTGHGYAKQMVQYYEEYAREHKCHCLRMDTQVINLAARKLYAGLGYREAGIVECVFNGIPNVQLVCLEKLI